MSTAQCKCKAVFCDNCHACSRCGCKCRKKRSRGRPRKEKEPIIAGGKSHTLRARGDHINYADGGTDDDGACSADADTTYSPAELTERKTKRSRNTSCSIAGKRNIVGQICEFADLGSANSWTLPSEQTRNSCTTLSEMTSKEKNRFVHFTTETCRKICALLLPNCSDEVFRAMVKNATGDSKLSPDDRILASSKIALSALPKESLQRAAIDSVIGGALVSGRLFGRRTILKGTL